MKNIAVIGSGTMGNGIAHTFAQFGYQVNLVDISDNALSKALSTINKNLDRQVAKGSLSEAEKAATLANITIQTNMQEGVAQADLIVEAATENLELKLKILRTWTLLPNLKPFWPAIPPLFPSPKSHLLPTAAIK